MWSRVTFTALLFYLALRADQFNVELLHVMAPTSERFAVGRG
jgi:hypothetical protein